MGVNHQLLLKRWDFKEVEVHKQGVYMLEITQNVLTPGFITCVRQLCSAVIAPTSAAGGRCGRDARGRFSQKLFMGWKILSTGIIVNRTSKVNVFSQWKHTQSWANVSHFLNKTPTCMCGLFVCADGSILSVNIGRFTSKIQRESLP